MEFSDKLKTLRLQANLTQNELANELSVSRQAISNYEQGRSYPSIDILLGMSKLFNQSLDELLESGAKKRYMKQLLIVSLVIFVSIIVSIISICIISFRNNLTAFNLVFSIIIYLVPFICLIIYLIFHYKPPKKINKTYGYRSKLSMKNQLMWDYAQAYFSLIYVKISIILFILNVLFSIITIFLNVYTYAIFGCIFFVFQLLWLPIPIYFVEEKLKFFCKKGGNN